MSEYTFITMRRNQSVFIQFNYRLVEKVQNHRLTILR